MAHINSPAQIKNIMTEHGLIFHKGLGQNFLFDEHYLTSIIDCGDITKEDTVLEIGPGLGVLTTRLAERAKKVIAIEIDQNIVPVLRSLTAEYGNVEVINADVLKTDINQILKDEKSVKIVANLPYYITTPIIMKLLEDKVKASCIVIMIQKEVAERLAALPGKKDYGAITVSVSYYSNPALMLTVPPGAFIPPPKVYSAVVRLDIPQKPNADVCDEKLFFKVIKAAFGQRRKTLVNALSSGFPQLSKDKIKEIITSCGHNDTVRGETLSLPDFASLSDKIYESIK